MKSRREGAAVQKHYRKAAARDLQRQPKPRPRPTVHLGDLMMRWERDELTHRRHQCISPQRQRGRASATVRLMKHLQTMGGYTCLEFGLLPCGGIASVAHSGHGSSRSFLPDPKGGRAAAGLLPVWEARVEGIKAAVRPGERCLSRARSVGAVGSRGRCLGVTVG